ncbi:glycoside hydrolase family 31 protein [Streptomyces cynarae]|uniref:Glycoside hydrolase family 31 protein n=1 Tax=Streptomyces cynarae TaxID=2981134 RepID=A0ABY6E8K0_9ACTN|nr:glycoside hydrolase family 31 protein [Streptomyces cynarae]UXY22987.1 glycoside hydrolase family 31 protein [Streptomyces cynarae]
MYQHVEAGIERRTQGEVLRVEPWGLHAVRVRAAADTIDDGPSWALDLPVPGAGKAEAHVREDGTARLVNGRITVEADGHGRLRFLRTGEGHEARELLAEKRPYHGCPGPRVHTPRGDGTYTAEQTFEGYDGERIHGLGQQPHGSLDHKGRVIDLVQRNTVVSIPFLHSSRGYGLLWNNPATGRVELAADATRWVAEQTRQVDYWIVAGDTPAEIMAAYADATGHPPLLPDWASGFWQSKLRYRTQDELLGVAREHHRRGLPLSVIVCDFFHWTRMGDWSFDPEDWPDPAAMTKELDSLGVRLVVSVWPTLQDDSANYEALRACGGLVRDSHGGLLRHHWPARGGDQRYLPMAYYDATHPRARQLLWEQLRANYAQLGVSAFWFDACEPDLPPSLAPRAVYHAGPGPQVGNAYGHEHARTVADGLRATGDDRPLSLIRSAWAGSQRHGVALWSGDILPTFDSLAAQVRTGLNVAMSGIPWWHTDIGGFLGGNPDDPGYRELLIRWFQYGTFSPVMRLHGDREPNQPFSARMSGGPNEVWSYGEQAYPVLRDHLLLRERLRPYLHGLAETAHRTGAPPMRPLFFDFPDDETAWDVDDQYMLGPDLLVAPVIEAGARERTVHLPHGARWIDTATGTEHEGGKTLPVAAPLERIPVFVRAGSRLAGTQVY